MNRLLVVLAMLSGASLMAEDLPSLTVAPSEVIRYPDSKDILNPVAPPVAGKGVGPLKVVGPLIGSTPVPAKTAPPAKPVTRPEHGWFLLWTLRGDEASTRAWWSSQTPWASRGEPLRTQTAVDTWEFALGPLDSAQWAEALSSPPEGTRLAKR